LQPQRANLGPGNGPVCEPRLPCWRRLARRPVETHHYAFLAFSASASASATIVTPVATINASLDQTAAGLAHADHGALAARQRQVGERDGG